MQDGPFSCSRALVVLRIVLSELRYGSSRFFGARSGRCDRFWERRIAPLPVGGGYWRCLFGSEA